jgi:hypothetical protein
MNYNSFELVVKPLYYNVPSDILRLISSFIFPDYKKNYIWVVNQLNSLETRIYKIYYEPLSYYTHNPQKQPSSLIYDDIHLRYMNKPNRDIKCNDRFTIFRYNVIEDGNIIDNYENGYIYGNLILQ